MTSVITLMEECCVIIQFSVLMVSKKLYSLDILNRCTYFSYFSGTFSRLMIFLKFL